MDKLGMKKHCPGCLYYHAYYRVNLCCNYLLDTGHRRPCPPGVQCTAKKPRLTGGASADSKYKQKF